jgi:DnaJ-class molecular chaperone
MVELVTCPRCNGIGDEIDYRKIRYNSIEPPYIICPECHGNGEVEQEQADKYDSNKSLNDYEADCRFEEWEHRQEEKQDRELDRR